MVDVEQNEWLEKEYEKLWEAFQNGTMDWKTYKAKSEKLSTQSSNRRKKEVDSNRATSRTTETWLITGAIIVFWVVVVRTWWTGSPSGSMGLLDLIPAWICWKYVWDK